MENKTFILEEHIYRWNCPLCGRDRTAYYKQIPQYLYCPDCMLDIDAPGYQSQKEAKMLEDFFKRDLPRIVMGHFGCDGKYRGINNTPLTPLDRGGIGDLERMNFVAWYRDATVEEIAIARRNNAAKLDELKKKYAAEIERMLYPRTLDGF